jgi:hypothetical protein
MVDFSEQKSKLAKLSETLSTTKAAIKIDVIDARIAELTSEQHADGFWNDMDNAQKVNRELKTLQSKRDKIDKLQGGIDDTSVLIELSEEGDDDSELDTINNDIAALTAKIDALRLENLAKRQI